MDRVGTEWGSFHNNYSGMVRARDFKFSGIILDICGYPAVPFLGKCRIPFNGHFGMESVPDPSKDLPFDCNNSVPICSCHSLAIVPRIVAEPDN